MKRAVISEPNEGRCLKRANSSLFSIATLADDDENLTETITGIMGGGRSPNLLLVDDGDMGEDEDASTSYSEMKASGLVTLDCSDDDAAAPDDTVSSSCSSSELDEQEDTNEVVCNSTQELKELADIAPVKKGDGTSRNCDLPVLLDKSLPYANKTSDQALPTSSSKIAIASQYLPCEPSTSGKVECKEEIQVTKSNDHLTGLVFESGSKHFDRHNRFHKERPLRITSVHDYLAKAKPADEEKTIFERSHLLESHGGEYCVEVESKKSPEELWLDDHDYLRVHLPGYMQRWVRTLWWCGISTTFPFCTFNHSPT